MIQTPKNKRKYKVFFRRVNTTTQNIELQESADAIYRESYLPNEILIMNEIGVSANTNIEKRPQMFRLTQLIMNDQVDIVYVYDLSRVFRNLYEFNYFDLLCKKHNVNIIYTSPANGNQQTTRCSLVDHLRNIVSDAD